VGCILTATVVITEPLALNTAITASTNPTCFGVCNGDATSSTSGGTGAYTYSWDDPGTQTTITATGLCVGAIQIMVTDANGCQDSATVTLTQPPTLALSTIDTNVSCNLGSDGSIDLTVTGGTPTYTYAWSNSATSQDLSNIGAGSYTVTVTDANGCIDSTTVVITEPIALTVVITTVNPNCGLSDGSVTATPTGGSGSYTYIWDDSGTSTNATVNNLGAGTYNVTVTDSLGCQVLGSGVITDVPGGTTTASVVADASGFGICDGEATGSMTAGTPPYTYSWDDPLNQSTAAADSLCAGTYCLTVIDSNGCSDSACIVIIEPTAIILTIVGTDLLCKGVCIGEADLTVSGGVLPYTYLWSNGLTAEDIINLCAGTYSVTVTDSNGVQAIASVDILEPALPLAAIVVGTDVLCNGDTTGAIDLTASGGTPPYTYSWAPNGETTEDLADLGIGTYTATVIDSNGCTVIASYTVTEPPALTLSTAQNDANCGQSDGDATVFPSGGTGAYTYSWNTVPAQTNAIATGLASAIYVATVTDSAGCSNTATVNISDLGGGVGSTTVDNDASCNGVCDGQATANIVGGTTPFTYNWDDPGTQSTAIATGLCAGTFNLTITDAVGCIVTLSAVIVEPVILTAPVAGADASCNGTCDGTATAAPAGGTAPYTYSWSTIPSQSTITATGLCANSYDVTVTDANNCDTIVTVVIGEPLAIVVSTTFVPSNCGQPDGQATASAVNGTLPYTYLWSDLGAQTNAIATGLLAASYNVTVSDANGCFGVGSVAVTDSTGPTSSITDSIDVTCAGDSDGELTVTVTDGQPPYTYSWSDGAAQTTLTATGLPVGSYTVLITDAVGCTTSATATVDGPTALVASITTSINANCNNACDGMATAGAAGGTLAYTFLWSNGQGVATASALCDSTYFVTVTDGAGCTDTTSVVITEPPLLTISISSTPANCADTCDATATISAGGGSAPYTYSWNDPGTQTTAFATGLCDGTYIGQVTDVNGCVANSTTIVTEPLPLATSVTAVGVDCNGDCDGTADVTVTDGVGPYTYLWSNGQTAALAINLCGGAYTVDIEDANGCIISDGAVISEPAPLANTFTITNVTCNGNADGIAATSITGGTTPYTYQWNDPGLQTTASATGLDAGTYTVNVTDSNGCILTDNATITEPIAIVLVIDTAGSNCGQDDGSATVTVSSGNGPFTYAWDDPGTQTTAMATGLFSGTYNIVVTDVNGCSQAEIAIVNDLGAPTITISSFSDANCNGVCDGFATVLITNGTPPYTYSWDDVGTQTTALATGLCAGSYIVSISDANLCSGSAAVLINEPTALNVVILSQSPVTCNGDCDGDATSLVSGGTPPYTYQWNDIGTQTTVTAVNLCAGTYGLTVEDDNGCTDTVSVVIVQPPVITLTTSFLDAHCGLSDGSACVTASGGNGLYGYSWDDPGTQNTSCAFNIPAGLYNVVVTDILGCTATIGVNVNDLPPGVATITVPINVSCNGGSDGSISVSMAGGTPPFTYLWTDPAAQTTVTATGLQAGGISVDVTDSNGCVVNAVGSLSEPAAMSLTFTSDSARCNGVCDGTATVFTSGGTLPYSYQWDDPLNQVTAGAGNLCADTFNVTVTDGSGCTILGSVIIEEPTAITFSETHLNAHCGLADGSGTVTTSGGTGPYTYSWNPGGQTTATANNLLANTYIVTVSDNNLCAGSISVTIADSAGPTIMITSSDSVSCNGGSDGTAAAVASGGVQPYTYLWDDSGAQITPTAGNLPVGIWTIQLTDSSGCVASASVTIFEPNPFVTITNGTSPSCFGSCDGDVGVSIIGGTLPYNYAWDDLLSQTNATATGLCSGTYNLIMTDDNGCIELASQTITDPAPVSASATSVDVSCTGICDGSTFVVASNGTAPYTYLWDDSQSQATPGAGSLCAGPYTVNITDANGCLASASTVVNSPAAVTVSISSSGNNACYGDCLGFAQTLVNGGTAPYTYLWGDGQTNAQAINLCAGIIDVTVTDSSGCSADTSVTITEPQPMVIITTSSNVTCNGACDGIIITNIGGGTPPYTYQWNDPALQTTFTATGLCNGVYGVTVTDNKGCSENVNVIISQPLPLGLVENTTSSTCGLANGGACVNIIGGVAPYVITWNDPGTTVGACIFNQVAGTYFPILVDSNGCTFTMPVIINDISGPTVDSIQVSDVICNGDSNGTAIVFASAVAPPITYSWSYNSNVIGTASTIFGLWGGVFNIELTDLNGCISGASVIINEPSLLSSQVINSSDATCNGVCDGWASVMVGGGTQPYSYLWTDGQTTSMAVGLCAGNHNVFVTDANACQSISTIYIDEPTPISIVGTIIDVSCASGSDGEIYTTVSGGTPFYLYSWNPNVGNNADVTNLTPQNYTLTVTDLHSCNELAVFTVNEPLPLGAGGTGIPSSCGGYNGSASVTPNGGTPPYTYLWDDPANTTTANVTGLQARDPYYVLITDAKGCQLTFSVTVGDQPGPTIDSILTVDLLCFNDGSGTAEAFASGGTAPLTYTWNDTLQGNPVSSLGAGGYNLTVADQNSCEDYLSIIIAEPAELVISSIADTTICTGQSIDIWVSANGGTPGFTYNWNNGLGNSPIHTVNPTVTTVYNVTIDDANGCTSATETITVTVNPPLSLNALNISICLGDDATITATASGGNGGPYFYAWDNGATTSSQTISGITSNTTFLVTISDQCSPDVNGSVDVTVNPIPDASFTGYGIGCEPYVFVGLPANAGTVPIQTWIWDFGDGSPVSNDPDSVSHIYTTSGQYTVTLVVISFNGCMDTVVQPGIADVYGLPTAEFIMSQGTIPANPMVTSILSPTIDFNNASSSNVDSLIWDFGDPNSGTDNSSNDPDPSHMYTDTGTYTVTLLVFTSVPGRCPDTVQHIVVIEGEYILFAPSAFTPNGDDDNDYFMPKGLGVDGEEFEMYIYDRWGDLIDKVTGVWSDDPNIGWDGHANEGESIAQNDVYVWLIRTQDFYGEEHEYIGHVTLLR
ncbi:MAG TPA: PKD domain-containing protein, partial [Flavobacteriales bacterium]|nr:PKD domain-containing protein [Flavobacteriales bacterium]